MTYLLDVNALLALGLANHQFHTRVAAWIEGQRSPQLATCPITELGFVRIVAQATVYGLNVAQARSMLLRMKKAAEPAFAFIADDRDASHLPTWVKTANQTTDGHLASLASANGAVLATLDRGIPGAYLIPE